MQNAPADFISRGQSYPSNVLGVWLIHLRHNSPRILEAVYYRNNNEILFTVISTGELPAFLWIATTSLFEQHSAFVYIGMRKDYEWIKVGGHVRHDRGGRGPIYGTIMSLRGDVLEIDMFGETRRFGCTIERVNSQWKPVTANEFFTNTSGQPEADAAPPDSLAQAPEPLLTVETADAAPQHVTSAWERINRDGEP